MVCAPAGRVIGQAVRVGLIAAVAQQSVEQGVDVALLALGVSALSLLLAGAAFGWQVLAWFMDGGRATAELRVGIYAHGSGLMSRPVDRDGSAAMSKVVSAQFPRADPLLVVLVTNRGRMPVQVTSYSAEIAGATGLSVSTSGPVVTGEHELPFVIPPGQRAFWWFPMTEVDALVYASQVVAPGRSTVRMTVTLGTGKTLRTKRSVRRPVPVGG